MKSTKYISRIFKTESLKKLFIKYFIRFFVIIIVPVLLLVYPFSFGLIKANEKQIETMNENVVKRSRDACDSILKQIEFYVINTTVDDNVRYFVSEGENDDNISDIQKNIRFYKAINSYIDSIAIYSQDSGSIITNHNYLHDTYFIKTLALTENDFKNPKKTVIRYYAKGDFYPYLIRMMRPIVINDKRGVVVAEILMPEFQKVLNPMRTSAKDEIMLLDPENNIIYSDNQSEYFMKPFSQYQKENLSSKSFVSKMKSAHYDITYLSVINSGYFMHTDKIILVFGILIFFVVGILGVCVSYYLTKKSISPVEEIIKAVKKGSSDLSDKKDVPLEVRYIVDDILSTINHQNKSFESIVSVRVFLLKLLTIQSLEAQISPHFLYNTLDSINWLAFSILGKNNAVSNSLNDLSKLFKFGLNTDSYVVTMREEISHIKIYERLIKRRYSDDINICYNVDDECIENHCIKFAIQPIVENAVSHGIRKNGGKGNILISAKTYDDYWEIEIADDGVGMSDEDIEKRNMEFSDENELDYELEKMISSYNEPNGDAISENSYPKQLGMSNVNKRIKLIFGNGYGIRLKRNDNGGLTVTVRQKNKMNK